MFIVIANVIATSPHIQFGPLFKEVLLSDTKPIPVYAKTEMDSHIEGIYRELPGPTFPPQPCLSASPVTYNTQYAQSNTSHCHNEMLDFKQLELTHANDDSSAYLSKLEHANVGTFLPSELSAIIPIDDASWSI